MSVQKKSRPGRPPKPNARRVTLRLPERVISYYTEMGTGELTRGIERVAERALERAERRRANQLVDG